VQAGSKLGFDRNRFRRDLLGPAVSVPDSEESLCQISSKTLCQIIRKVTALDPDINQVPYRSRVPLIGPSQDRSGLRVVGNERSEGLHRNVRRGPWKMSELMSKARREIQISYFFPICTRSISSRVSWSPDRSQTADLHFL
jgi:hypothetical protein